MAGKGETAEKGAPSKRSALPVLDDEGSLPADVALALSEADRRAVCAAAGRVYGGMTVVDDKAFF